MSVLRIYFPFNWRDSASSCPWALCDESGAVLQSGNDSLASMPKGKDCIAIISPELVLGITAKLPPGTGRRWQAALPFVAEEYTLTEPEDIHVVPGSTQADGRLVLLIVDKHWLKRVVDACITAGLSLRRMIPETFLPLVTPGCWTMVWDGISGFLRTGTNNGMVLDSGDQDTAPLTLKLSLDSIQKNPESTLPEKIEVLFPSHVPDALRILPQWRNLPTVLVSGPVWDWRRIPIPANALNLLWGEFTPRARISEYWPKFRPVVMLLLLALGVETLGVNIQWAILAHEHHTLTQSMEHSFRSTFGETVTLVNAPLQMGRKIAELRHEAGLPDDGDFLVLLDAAAATLAALPADSIRGMHYETGKLDVDIRLGNAKNVQDLRKNLQSKGLAVQLGDLHEEANGMESKLTLLPGEGR